MSTSVTRLRVKRGEIKCSDWQLIKALFRFNNSSTFILLIRSWKSGGKVVGVRRLLLLKPSTPHHTLHSPSTLRVGIKRFSVIALR